MKNVNEDDSGIYAEFKVSNTTRGTDSLIEASENLPALIVCPAIAKTVWESAFAKLAPNVSLHVVNGKREASEVNSADITIINYDVLQYALQPHAIGVGVY